MKLVLLWIVGVWMVMVRGCSRVPEPTYPRGEKYQYFYEALCRTSEGHVVTNDGAGAMALAYLPECDGDNLDFELSVRLKSESSKFKDAGVVFNMQDEPDPFTYKNDDGKHLYVGIRGQMNTMVVGYMNWHLLIKELTGPKCNRGKWTTLHVEIMATLEK